MVLKAFIRKEEISQSNNPIPPQGNNKEQKSMKLKI
jgi:hypothetical protein